MDNNSKNEDGSLLKMAIKDIPSGNPLPYTNIAGQNKTRWDYSHVLSPLQKANGYSIDLVDHGPRYVVNLRHKDSSIGSVMAYKRENYKTIEPHADPLDFNHRGKGLGKAMYETLYAHAFHNGFRGVMGGGHTEAAGRVHEALSRKHGLDYDPAYKDPSIPKRGPYKYQLKSELNKMALKDIPVGERVDARPGDSRTQEFDYSHVLPENARNDYSLLVKHRVSLDDGDRSIYAHLYHKSSGVVVGRVLSSMYYGDNTHRIENAHLNKNLRGKGLGLAMYEANMAHAKNALGATHTAGGDHSTLADSIHKKLAQKHGMEYFAKRHSPSSDDGEYDAAFGDYHYQLKSELNKMAVADIPIGKRINSSTGEEKFDYSHLLPSNLNKKGYKLHVWHEPEVPELGGHVFSVLHHGRNEVGQITSHFSGDAILPGMSEIDHEYRGQGLGLSMYEALMAHSKNYLNADVIQGGKHSSAAHAVHQKLAEKHGMQYDASRIHHAPSKDFDNAYGSYKYNLKSEDSLEKMALKDIKAGAKMSAPSAREGQQRFDYSHMLPDHAKNKYKLVVTTTPGMTIYNEEAIPEKRSHVKATLHSVGRNPAANPNESNELGVVSGSVGLTNKNHKFAYADLEAAHRGQGLGMALYEANLAHAHNVMGAATTSGGLHSTLAHRTHSRLAAKHGMDYQAEKKHDPWPAGLEFDDAYGPYKYQLKGEMDETELDPEEGMAIPGELNKMALVWDNENEPKTVYRLQDEHGNGPYNPKYKAHRGFFEFDKIRDVVYRNHAPELGDYNPQPSPHFDFPSDERSDLLADKKPLFGFESPHHAENWFGAHNLATLKKDYGFNLVPVKASKIFRSDSGKQIMFHPHSSELDKYKKIIKDEMPSTRHNLNLPAGSELNGKIKVRHIAGDESWKSVRAGQILSADPALHPTSSREPGAR